MSVRIAKTPDLKDCLAIRAQVFIVEQGVPEADELDGLDQNATHLLARSDGIPVGTLRLRQIDDHAKIERVCVLARHRGQGHAAALTREALRIIATWPVRSVKLSAQIDVIPFYERFGFTATGGVYMDAGILHRDMVRAP